MTMQATKYFKSGGIAAAALLIGGIGYFMFKQSSASADLNTTQPSQPQTNQTTTASPQEQLKQSLADGALLIDVRTPEEFAAGHAKAAINLPLADIQNGQLPQVAKDHPIYLYCRSGNRSGIAVGVLKQQGYSKLVNLGGLGNLQRLGFEIVQ